MKNKIFLTIIALLSFIGIKAQLDLEHWFPPYFRGDGVAIEETYIYLSTDHVVPFKVNIYNNNILVDQVIVSKENPIAYLINDDSMIDAGTVRRTMKATSMGFHLTGEFSFFASLRIAGCSPSAGCTSEIIGSKGKSALGKEFLSVSDDIVLYGNSPKNKNYQFSVMATKDDTHIKVNGFDNRLVFADGSVLDELNFVLQKGESYMVVALKADNNISNPPILDDNDPKLIGAHIISDKPIVVNSGNMQSQDIGEGGGNANMDQLLPISKLGKEFFMSNGMTIAQRGIMEKVLIVPTKDNTSIFFNNEINPVTKINKGQFYLGPMQGAKFLNSDQPGFTNSEGKVIPTTVMYIKTSEPVYLFQMIGGYHNLVRGPAISMTPFSSGATFSYPIDADYSSKPEQSHQNYIQIPFIDKIGTKSVNSKLVIKTTKDANVKLNGVQINSFSQITGKEDWKYFVYPLISGNVEVSSDRSLMVDHLGGFPYSGFATSYTGFSNDPYIIVNGACIQEDVVLSLSNNDFERFQWKKDGMDILGATFSTFQPTIAGSYSCEVFYPGFSFTTPPVTVVDCPYNVIDVDGGEICNDFVIQSKFYVGNHTMSKLEIITQPLHASSVVDGDKIKVKSIDSFVGQDRLVYKITAIDGYYEIVKVRFSILPKPIGDLKTVLEPIRIEGQNFYFDFSKAIITDNGEEFHYFLSEQDAMSFSNEILDFQNYLGKSQDIFILVRNGGTCTIIKKVKLIIPNVQPPTDSGILLPNAFSPNGDGINDIWDYSILKDFQNVKLVVIDRYGKLIYEHKDKFTWDGRDQNYKKLPTGSYWVSFSYDDLNVRFSKNQWLLLKNN